MLAKSILVIFFLQFCLLDGITGQLNVTLAVFSGRPDPQWFLLSSPNSRFAQIRSLLVAARTKKFTYSPNQMPPRLGYKGFLIQELTQKQPELIVGRDTVELQKQLFQTLPTSWLQDKKMQEFFNRVLKEEIIPGKITAVSKQQQQQKQELLLQKLQQQQQQRQGGKRRKRYAYQYSPNSWNVVPTQLTNNCYNYANNKATNTYAQPGRGSGDRCTIMLGNCMRNAAINDHLENLENGPPLGAPVQKAPNGKKHLVALAVAFGIDYHWFRLDQLGVWSHKVGMTPATVIDNAGIVIADPRQANTGIYNFVCFMYSSRDDVTIA